MFSFRTYEGLNPYTLSATSAFHLVLSTMILGLALKACQALINFPNYFQVCSIRKSNFKLEILQTL